jgi:hypothetical protein
MNAGTPNRTNNHLSTQLLPNRRSVLAIALFGLLAVGIATRNKAHAQGAPVFPTILDLHQVKVGDWAEYQLTIPNGTMKQRMAIISRDEKNTTLEMSVEGGPMAAMGMMLIQVKIPRDPKLESKPTGVIMQVGKNLPMEMPKDHPMVPKESFKRLNATQLEEKSETINVSAGTFSCKRHVQKRGEEQATTWLSDKASPLGLVKMESKTSMGSAKVELMKLGKGAISSIKTKPIPFDQNIFMQQIMAGMAGSKK